MSFLLAGCLSSGDEAAPNGAGSELGAEVSAYPPLRIELTTDQTVYRVGDALRYDVRIINQTDENLWLVGSLDGSARGGRYPKLTAQIERPSADVAPVLGYCGNMNNLRRADFVRVRPGEGFDPYGDPAITGYFPHYELRQGFRTPGEHTFVLVYDTTSNDPAEWLGFMGPGEPSRWMRRQIEAMPRVRVVSEPLTVTVLSAE